MEIVEELTKRKTERVRKMEYIDVCTEDGKPTGRVVERAAAHRDGTLHRTAHVWIVRRNGRGEPEILLQKRSRSKDSFPGYYDTSSAGHIPAGDEPLLSAVRELYEELGIIAEPEQLKFAGTFRSQYEKVFYDRLFRDNEHTTVYVYDLPADSFRLQESEVEEVRWFNLKEVYREIQTNRERICVPKQGLDVLIDYIKKQNNIDIRE